MKSNWYTAKKLTEVPIIYSHFPIIMHLLFYLVQKTCWIHKQNTPLKSTNAFMQPVSTKVLSQILLCWCIETTFINCCQQNRVKTHQLCLIPIIRDVQFRIFENQLADTNNDTYAKVDTDTNTSTNPCTSFAHGSLQPTILKGWLSRAMNSLMFLRFFTFWWSLLCFLALSDERRKGCWQVFAKPEALLCSSGLADELAGFRATSWAQVSTQHGCCLTASTTAAEC